MKDMNAADWVAIILATGISLALLVMTVAALYGAIVVHTGALSENATQVLTGWGGGMIGVLGAYVGYRFGAKANGHGKTGPKCGG